MEFCITLLSRVNEMCCSIITVSGWNVANLPQKFTELDYVTYAKRVCTSCDEFFCGAGEDHYNLWFMD